MTIRHDSITAELALRLVVPGGAPVPVAATVRYEPADPYAISIGFRTGADEVVEWTFARQLLSDGVRRPAGDGDVQVWPAAQSGGRIVCLSLSSPSGHALFEMPRSEVLAFLRRTYSAVPLGGESDIIDLDAELALLIWGGPERSAGAGTVRQGELLPHRLLHPRQFPSIACRASTCLTSTHPPGRRPSGQAGRRWCAGAGRPLDLSRSPGPPAGGP